VDEGERRREVGLSPDDGQYIVDRVDGQHVKHVENEVVGETYEADTAKHNHVRLASPRSPTFCTR